LHPANIPAILSPQQARQHPELAVLSAVAHGQDADVDKSVEIAFAAQSATAALDTDRSTLYFDLILSSLSEAARRALETMDVPKYQYQSDFARRYFSQGEAQGKAEGKAEGIAEGQAEGRAEMALKLLSLRFGALPEAVQNTVRHASVSELDALAERLLSSGTLREALGRLG
jgi:predicted transposase YdaD